MATASADVAPPAPTSHDNSAAATTDLESLPADAVAHIMALLQPRDACALAAASTTCRQHAYNEHAWKQHCVSEHGDHTRVATWLQPPEVPGGPHSYRYVCCVVTLLFIVRCCQSSVLQPPPPLPHLPPPPTHTPNHHTPAPMQ